MNMLKDLLTPEEFKNYQLTPFPFNIKITNDALKKKLKEDIDYEVFSPLIYYKFTDTPKYLGGSQLIAPYKYFVSNKGNVISLRGKSPLVIGTSKNKRGYSRFNVSSNKSTQIKLLLHRAVACSFTPVLREGSPMHPKELHVNHIDGIKENCEASNLEWCTDIENKDHAAKTGLIASGERHYAIKPVKGTVLSGKFKGHQFILIGTKEIKEYGFSSVVISRCCLGKIQSHLNCNFSFANKEEISSLTRGITKEIFKSLIDLGFRVKSDILATNIKTGEKIIIKGGLPELLKLGFEGSSVSKAISKKLKTHKGYVFERI